MLVGGARPTTRGVSEVHSHRRAGDDRYVLIGGIPVRISHGDDRGDIQARNRQQGAPSIGSSASTRRVRRREDVRERRSRFQVGTVRPNRYFIKAIENTPLMCDQLLEWSLI